MSERSIKTILLVEDDPISAIIQKTVLERHGFLVRGAGSGEAAIEAAASQPDISLVLMDIDLGSGMDGTEAAKTLIAAHDLPVVFCHRTPNRR